MTTHALAKLLAAGSDIPVVVEGVRGQEGLTVEVLSVVWDRLSAFGPGCRQEFDPVTGYPPRQDVAMVRGYETVGVEMEVEGSISTRRNGGGI